MAKTFSTKGRKTDAAEQIATKKKEVKASADRVWSDEQVAIFDHCAKKTENLVVRARAGTGKTTTIVESIKWLVQDGAPLLTAFNKRIKEELDKRVNGGAHVYTLHGLGFRFVKKGWPGVDVDEHRGLRLAAQALTTVNKPATKDWQIAVDKLAGMVKGIAPFTWEAEGTLAALAIGYGTDDTLPRDYDRDAYYAATREALKLALKEDGTINFDDMLYVPLLHKMIYPCYNVVLVDEAQDMNKAQLEIAIRTCRKDGKMIIVGDDRQAIYGFRGADSGSIDRLKEALKADELGLKTTYRCPKLIVKLAKKTVPDFKAAPTAPEGTIRRIPLTKLGTEAQPGDFVLSRTNAPLLSAVLEFIRQGKRAKIEGRDIGRGLQGIIHRLKPMTVDEVPILVSEWAAQSITRAAGSESRIQQIMDQADILTLLSEDVTLKSVPDMLRKIDDLFTDDEHRDNRIVCSTVHKAKGLEADRVFLLTHTFKQALTGEESNLNYVAITRAKKELIWVDDIVRMEASDFSVDKFALKAEAGIDE